MGQDCTKDFTDTGDDQVEEEERRKKMVNRILNQQTKLRLFNEDDDETKLDNLSENTYNAVTLSVVPSARKVAKRCYIEVNLKSFHTNLKQIKNMADASDCEIIAVLKANAYGHGAVTIAQECLEQKVNNFAVATVGEGIELRQYNGLKVEDGPRIIVLGAAAKEEYELYADYKLDLMLSGPEMVKSLLEWGQNRKDKHKSIDVHCMMDTGMTRIGFQHNDCLDTIHELVKQDNGVKFIGLCTHMADAPHEEYTLKQFDRFTSVLKQLESDNINVEMFHCENSKSLMCDVIEDEIVKSYMDHDTKGYVRVGGALHGFTPTVNNIKMLPTITLKAQIRHIAAIQKGTPVGYGQKKSWQAPDDVLIATLGIGYADGYPRGMSNKEKVIRIGDNLYDVAGKVCMDMMMVNLGNVEKNPEIKNISVGDYAVLFGPKEEHESNPDVKWIAKQLGDYSSPLEILCGIAKRVPYIYTNDEA